MIEAINQGNHLAVYAHWPTVLPWTIEQRTYCQIINENHAALGRILEIRRMSDNTSRIQVESTTEHVLISIGRDVRRLLMEACEKIDSNSQVKEIETYRYGWWSSVDLFACDTEFSLWKNLQGQAIYGQYFSQDGKVRLHTGDWLITLSSDEVIKYLQNLPSFTH